jgi:SAM-dependent methyltransferase
VSQADINASVWRAGRFLPEYDSRVLEPAEVLILARYREAFSGRVLDVGCGGGRILGYLVALGGEAHGIDISSTMVEHCRRRFPGADVEVGDLLALGQSVSGPFDVVLLSDNVLDVFDDAQRRTVLDDVHGLLAPGGMIVFSSHNLAAWERPAASAPGEPERGRGRAIAAKLADRSPRWMLDATVRLPRRAANRRRLGPMQYRAADHGVFNDSAHDYGLLHYYISRADQDRQLSELGYDLVEAMEFDGSAVPAGAEGQGPSIYYVARAR